MFKTVIFPQDWVLRHPYKQTDEVDHYYSQLANRVYHRLRESPMYDMEEIFGDTKLLAIYLTCWFEDIISGTNVWRTVNRECQRRIGAKLPFYDTSEYYDGEPNINDLRLLLWYYAELHNENKHFFNPENPAIETVATDLCSIFDEAYPDAPENERLRDYLLRPNLTTDYWKTREVMDWFGTNSYIMVNPLERILSFVEENSTDSMSFEQQMYAEHVQHVFRGRENLLSFTTAEWLTAMRSDLGKDDILPKMVQTTMRLMEVISVSEQTIVVHDLTADEEYPITRDSWTATDPFQKKLSVGMKFVGNTISFGDVRYHCGVLAEFSQKTPDDMFMNLPQDQSYLLEGWNRVSNGDPVVFYRNENERQKIFKKMNITEGEEVDVPEQFRQGAIGFSPKKGLCFINHCECICSEKNPFYNKDIAQKSAHNFFCTSTIAPYEVCRALFEAGWLPDARINSLSGEEYGAAFLKRHGQFIMDYFHEEYE